MKLGSVSDVGFTGLGWCCAVKEKTVGTAGMIMDGLWREGLGLGVIKAPGLL